MAEFWVFSERKKLEAEFLEWAKENNVKVCPFSVISWLIGAKGFEPKEE